ncbi:PPC domain-containing protein [Rubrivirga sp.]|uniref:PPC domain-containing protein n=1 Tax=Rubrivirga sp. TaxID=1885344 RepID=UPI003C74ED4F
MRFLLLLAAVALLAVPADAQPRRGGAPQQTLSVSDALATVAVNAGGSDRNAVPGSGCSGFINNGTPTAAVEVSGDGPLSIYATSGTDTTLLVSDPAGRWHCSDDANGSNPAVTFAQAAAGTYVVWVGTFSPDEAAGAQLSATRGQPSW